MNPVFSMVNHQFIETTPFRNNDLTYLKVSGCVVVRVNPACLPPAGFKPEVIF